MNIEDVVSQRGIEEVLHFTTNYGLTGILASGAIKARSLLVEDAYIEHILKPNCPDRSRDAAWHGYVNLSITRINSRLFGIAEGNWHRALNGWWCIVSFDSTILAHEGIVFTTTNNIYPAVRRGRGVTGLNAMFRDPVLGIYSRPITRHADQPTNEPTCGQAEVLYPNELSTNYLKRIYVRDAEHSDQVCGILGALSLEPVECIVSPLHFQ